MYSFDDLRLPRYGFQICPPVLPCPFCRSNLSASPHITIASGCCYQCGRRVLDFPKQISEPVHSFEEISQKCVDEHSHLKQMGCFIIGGYLFFTFFSKLIAPAFGIPLGWLFQGFTLTGPFFILALFVFLFRRYLDTKRSYHCEHCQSNVTKLQVELLNLTGRCPNCAQRIVKDPGLPAGKKESPRLDIDTFTKEFKPYRRRFMIAFLWACLTFLMLLFLNSDFQFFMSIKAYLINRFGRVSGWIVIILAQGLFVLLNIIPMIWEYFRNPLASQVEDSQESGIACPCCHKIIYQPEISIATKRCHHCREVVFAEPEKRELV